MIKITIDGERRTGKSTVAMAIKHLLEKHGANVILSEGTVAANEQTTAQYPDLRSATKVISPILTVQIEVKNS